MSFSQGFCQVERVMKNLFLRHLHLWPRYHSTVSSVLASCQPQVVEIHLQLTPKMQDVQTAVLDLISFTLKEVKRLNPSLNSEELTVENSMSKSFHKILQRELDPVWHQLSAKSRQLVSDLKTLRLVLTYLTQYDCITFYTFVSTLKTTESAMKSGGWVLLDSAETLFLTARDRVFSNMENSKKKGKTGDKESLFEENPKWTEIGKVIEEIKEEMVKDNKDPASEKVMIVTRDERTARQVNDSDSDNDNDIDSDNDDTVTSLAEQHAGQHSRVYVRRLGDSEHQARMIIYIYKRLYVCHSVTKFPL